MKLYVSEHCPDCPPAIALLEAKGIEVELINITSSMVNLKEFLNLRDTRSEFDEIKKEGCVGIPCLLKDNGTIEFL